MDNQQPMMAGKTCKCGHHMVVPILIILIGLDAFLGALGTLTPGFVAMTWPILLILIGLMKIMGRSCKCCSC